MKDRVFVICLGLIVANGCAFIDQKARLDPQLRLTPSGLGSGRTVAVRAADERPRDLIGRRGLAGGGAITTDQDIAELVRQKVIEGLQQSGFTVAGPEGGAAQTLSVEVRALEYELAQGFWSGSVNTRAAMKGICGRNGSAYEKIYRGEYKRGFFWGVPTATRNEELLNVALSEALNRMLGDRDLLACLAR